MNKSGHQVLTIKAIHYPTVPRDCICEILLGVKDGESRGGGKIMVSDSDETHSDVSLDSSTLRPQLSYSFTALSQKVQEPPLLKYFLTAKVSQGVRRKRRDEAPCL